MNQRLVALDVFRGLTVALMILVNNPGSWGHIYSPLRHAQWHGLTPTDLVFPFFLFIVGVAVSLGFSRRFAAGTSPRDLIKKILLRTAIIFGLGIFLNGFPFGLFGPKTLHEIIENLRVAGVLQRIALSYFLVASTVVFVRSNTRRLVMAMSWLIFYEVLMRWPMVAGWGGGSFALEDNFVRFMDLRLLGQSHLYHIGSVAFDPEGLLSTFPAAFTAMSGFLAGEQIRRPQGLNHRLIGLVITGFLLTGLGLNLALVEPVNKQLWTVSYAILTSGLATLLLTACLWFIDGLGWKRGTQPAVIFGRNPLVVFVGSGITARLLYLIKVTGADGRQMSLKQAIYQGGFEPLAGPLNGSLLYALTFLGLWMIILWWMDHRNIHIKV